MDREILSAFCPLYGTLNDIDPTPDGDDPELYLRLSIRISSCVKIIENSRIIWECIPYKPISAFQCCPKPEDIPDYPAWKITSARKIWNIYNFDFELLIKNEIMDIAKISNTEWKEAVYKARLLSKIDNRISDSEILAIFAIYEAFKAYYGMVDFGYSESNPDIIKWINASINLLMLAEEENKKFLQLKVQNMQSKPVSEKQNNVPSKRVDVVSSINVSPGTKWEDILIYVTDKDKIQISGKGIDLIEKKFSEIGFKKEYNNESKISWALLMFYAAAENNTLNKKHKLVKEKINLKSQTKALCKILQDLFKSVEGKPITHKDGIGYKPVFKLGYSPDITERIRNTMSDSLSNSLIIKKKSASINDHIKSQKSNEENHRDD